MSATRDDTIPVEFELPDGDIASVITWGYVVGQIKDFMQTLTEKESLVNESLVQIDNKLSEWISQQ